MFFGNVRIQVCLGLRKVWTLSAMKCSIQTPFLVTPKIERCSWRSTFLTRNFIDADGERHLINIAVTEINVMIVAT